MQAHGLMLHHFKGGNHPDGQGAITADQFADILEHIGLENFLSPQEWTDKALKNRLSPSDRCITLDDALLCQFEIAEPVLQSFGLQAFWFVYSGVFEGEADRLEIYRHYRNVSHQDIDSFYDAFFRALNDSPHGSEYRRATEDFDPKHYLEQFAFYTDNDRLFRFVRDKVLGPARYFEVMDAMIAADANYDRGEAARGLWMDDGHLRDLHANGHEIGLHSYTHPTEMASLAPSRQAEEYFKNFEHISRVIGFAPTSVSHPCGSYTEDTLQILRSMGVNVGFRSDMKLVDDNLCSPRQDHSNIAIEMGIR